ncbi:MAG: hypothetical protein ACTSRS_01100 [Candidatus Helarchaeota archaeon]
MLKVGQRVVIAKYTGKGGKKEKAVTLSLYKLKGLRGLLRRSSEVALLRLRKTGLVNMGPCTPNANYPHDEILQEHIDMGYHLQGSCNPMCYVRRLYGSLGHPGALTLFPPYIAKPTAENIPLSITKYLEENIAIIFGMNGIVFHNGESTLKVETFNIINRKTEQAVNNFMKHLISGTFPFKVIFKFTDGTLPEFFEMIGFFLTSLYEINGHLGLQLGADKSNGSGRVTIQIKRALANQHLPELEPFITTKIEHSRMVQFGAHELHQVWAEYQLADPFGAYALECFKTAVGQS